MRTSTPIRLALGAALGLAASIVPAFAGGTAAAPARSLTGEIVDTGCYLGHGAKGADHTSCAQKCLDGGMPAGLLTPDGTVYLLTMNHDNADAYNQARKMAAQTVTVTGPLVEKGGMKAIQVDNVAAATK